MDNMDRLRRGEAGGVRRRHASPVPPPDPCSNMCSTLLKVNPLRLGCVKCQSRKGAGLGSHRGLMGAVRPVDTTRFAGTPANAGARR
jgi:hypothetical protein